MRNDIGFDEALGLALQNVSAMAGETLPVDRAVGRVVARPVHARVDSPSVDASLKDGYAVVSADIAGAARHAPVRLEVTGCVAAGSRPQQAVAPAKAVRVLSGAPVPPGADAVVAEEFTDRGEPVLEVYAPAEPGRNILEKGADVTRGECIAGAGSLLLPQHAGLLVAGGIFEVPVVGRPKIGLLATGSELLLPGSPMEAGKIFASNIALQHAWLRAGGLEVEMRAAGDEKDRIASEIRDLVSAADVLITSGGAWKSDRDLVVGVLESLGCRMIFHRVRMGPGKAVGMGILENKPVFCLPGGPASNETAFMFIVYPAIRKMAGFGTCPYLGLRGRLERGVSGQADWTQFIQCDIVRQGEETRLVPKKLKSRMAAMARTPAVIMIAEGVSEIPAGARVPFTCFDPEPFCHPVQGPLNSAGDWP